MQIDIRLNGSLAQTVGAPRTRLDVPEGTTIAELLKLLAAKYPAAKDQLPLAIPVIGGNHTSKATILTVPQELALLMPVAGG